MGPIIADLVLFMVLSLPARSISARDGLRATLRLESDRMDRSARPGGAAGRGVLGEDCDPAPSSSVSARGGCSGAGALASEPWRAATWAWNTDFSEVLARSRRPGGGARELGRAAGGVGLSAGLGGGSGMGSWRERRRFFLLSLGVGQSLSSISESTEKAVACAVCSANAWRCLAPCLARPDIFSTRLSLGPRALGLLGILDGDGCAVGPLPGKRVVKNVPRPGGAAATAGDGLVGSVIGGAGVGSAPVGRSASSSSSPIVAGTVIVRSSGVASTGVLGFAWLSVDDLESVLAESQGSLALRTSSSTPSHRNSAASPSPSASCSAAATASSSFLSAHLRPALLMRALLPGSLALAMVRRIFSSRSLRSTLRPAEWALLKYSRKMAMTKFMIMTMARKWNEMNSRHMLQLRATTMELYMGVVQLEFITSRTNA
mmetsp:Transcript_263/g.780  ORF Transcript_263/g.780 Transcript_263/m.780 type:complete len:432 (-) Transcript_263:6469-7764(-)